MNAELFVLRGLLHVFTTVALESLVGGGNWSTQSIRQDAWHFDVLGQISFRGKRARINWVLNHGGEKKQIRQMIDHLVFKAGIYKAEYVLADVDVGNPVFECLRQAGFAPCGWGQVWQVDSDRLPKNDQAGTWSTPSTADGIELLGLQRRLMPPAAQAVSRLADERLPDFILRQDGRIIAFADCVVFGQKVMVRLTYDTCSPTLSHMLGALFREHYPATPARYIMQRGDQALMQESLPDYAQLVVPRFERLVNYLTVPVKVPVGASAAVNNRHHADPVTPMLKSSGRQDNL